MNNQQASAERVLLFNAVVGDGGGKGYGNSRRAFNCVRSLFPFPNATMKLNTTLAVIHFLLAPSPAWFCCDARA